MRDPVKTYPLNQARKGTSSAITLSALTGYPTTPQRHGKVRDGAHRLDRPFRALSAFWADMPWAGVGRAVGALKAAPMAPSRPRRWRCEAAPQRGSLSGTPRGRIAALGTDTGIGSGVVGALHSCFKGALHMCALAGHATPVPFCQHQRKSSSVRAPKLQIRQRHPVARKEENRSKLSPIMGASWHPGACPRPAGGSINRAAVVPFDTGRTRPTGGPLDARKNGSGHVLG